MRPFRVSLPAPLLLAACMALAIAGGCAPRNGAVANTGYPESTEFRLRSLETKYLELERRQDQLEQQAMQRITALEEIVADYQGQIAVLRSIIIERGATPPPAPPAPKPRPAPKAKAKPSAPSPPAKPKAKAPAPAPTPGPAPAAEEKKPAAASPAPATSGAAGQQLYEQALTRIQAGKPAEAIPMLERFVKENPGSPLAVDALFWLGESHFHTGGFDEAILAYKDVAGRNPGHAKAPAAMLKIGYAYEQMGDPNNARFYLQALVDEYPASEEASLASRKITQLGF